MKKTIPVVLCAAVLIACVASGCGQSGNKKQTSETTTSFEEMASYYDNLAKGDNKVEILTTGPNSRYVFEGDVSSLPDGTYEKLVEVIERCYLKIYTEYGFSYNAPVITVSIDPTYSGRGANYVMGNTIVLNAGWFTSHPDDYDSIIEALVGVAQNYPVNMPEWLSSSIRYYGRDEYAIYSKNSSYSLTGRYAGGSYVEGGFTGASFLKWLSATYKVNMASVINGDIHNRGTYSEKVWTEQTGKTLEQLWSQYIGSGGK